MSSEFENNDYQPEGNYQPQVEPQQPAEPQQPVEPQQAADPQPVEWIKSYGSWGPQSYGSNVPPMGPMSGYNVSPEPPKRKKGVSGKVVAAIVVLCILMGGLMGGGIAAVVRGVSEHTAQTPPQETETSELVMNVTSQEEGSAIHTTTIDVTTNSPETTMTPQDVYENYVNAVVAISNESTTTNYWGQTTPKASSGSGMIISKDGYIITNNHVVEGAEKLTVLTTAGEEYEAKIIGADSANDVALIKVQGDKDFPTVSVGDSDNIQVGQQVCAIGNPLGELTNTLTVGYVSALDREITESTGNSINMFQTDCAINSGNSGGPIFNMNGNVIGITTAKPSSALSSATVEGIGFCIPIKDAMNIVNDLLEYGYVRGRVSMGISCQNVNSAVTQYNLPVGPYVMEVSKDSAAEKAGLQQGDLICAIDGEDTQTITEMKSKLKEYKPGDTAKLSIYRTETGEKMELEITFDEMQSTASQNTEEPESQDNQQQQGQQSNPFEGFNPFNPFG